MCYAITQFISFNHEVFNYVVVLLANIPCQASALKAIS